MTMTEATKVTHGFQTEVSQLLDLVTHSLYSNKEIFLRELISNAADAADKLRFKALSDNSLYENDGDLKVRIEIDKENRTLTVSDNGIGMSREEIIENLGTIAKSGTKEFFARLSGDEAKDSHLIGQFGVGFYSAFIVADKVTVKSRAAGDDATKGTIWESDGKSQFSVEETEIAQRGTSITLHLKEGESEFLQDYRIRSVVSKYSDHINIPVEMAKIEMPSMDEESDETEEKDDSPKAPEFEVVNQAKALWTLSKSEVSEEQYKEFYKHISHDFEEPLTWAHNKVEGKMEYTSLLYIPKNPPFDVWNRDQKHGLKLYVQRVFIMDDAEQFMPTYLRFVKGIIDSNDLPLNVSREILQDSKITRDLRKGCVKRVLSTLNKLALNEPEAYQTFWKGFGQILKEGPAEDMSNKEDIAKLLRFASTHTDESVQNVSLEDYIGRMKEGQDKIYYVTGESFSAVKNSPHLEVFRKKGIEVLLLSERIDDWLMSHLTEFKEAKFQSITRGKLDLGELDSEEEKEKVEETEKAFESLIKQIKESLGDRVKEVRITHRLTESPTCVVGDESDMGSQMAMLLKAAGQAVPESKPIFEVNTSHSLIERLSQEQDDERFGQWVDVLFEQALLAERGHLEDPAGFVSRLNKLLQQLAI